MKYKKEVISMENQKKLYINAGTVIVNLLKEEKKKYLTLERLEELVYYIHEQLVEQNYIKEFQDIIFNVNFNAIERTVLYNNNIFELVGDTIYLKCDQIPEQIIEKYNSDGIIVEIIKQFVNAA